MVRLTLLLGALVAITAAVTTTTVQSAAAALSSLGFSLPPGDVPIGNPEYTCNILDRVFSKNRTFTESSPYYDPLVDEAWSQNCRLSASCIVTPESAREVSLLLQILGILETTFSIRSGGHSYNPGFSSVGSNGVLIALERLNTVSISADHRTVTVGPGNRWDAVYEYLEPYNVSALGGRQVHVGVGGFTLGGGLSTFYNTHGLALDSVTRFQVVLPNGTIVDATQRENADLYRGLKGGLNNFGIVVEYELTTNPDTDIYYEVQTYTTANTPALLAAYATYLLDADVNSNIEIQTNPNSTLVFYGYLGHVAAPAAFAPFLDIPVASTLFPPTNGSLYEFLFTIGSPGQTSSGITYGVTFTFNVTNPDFLQDSYDTYLEAAASLPPGTDLTYVPQGVTPNLVNTGQSQNGGNLLGLESTPQIWANIFAQFPSTVDEPTVTRTVELLLADLIASAESQGVLLPYIFVNDAGHNQKPLQSLGRESLEYIDAVARRYDPEGVMQRLQNEGYLVSEAL